MQLSYIHYQIAFVGITFLFVYFIYTKKYAKSFYLFIFILPIKNIYFYIAGAFLELWKFLSIIYMVYIFSHIFNKIKSKKSSFIYILIILYILMASVITILYGYMYEDNTLTTTSLFKTIFRPLSQILLFLTFFSLLFVPSVFLNRKTEIVLSFEFYLKSMLLLSLLGVFQWVSMYLLHYNPFPIPRLSGELQMEAQLLILKQTVGVDMGRLTSICLEPKNYAIYLAFGIVVVLEFLSRRINTNISKKKLYLFLVLFFVNLLFTFSTTGYIAVVLYLIVKTITSKASFGIGILIITFSSLYFVSETFKTLIDSRLINRIVLEEFDQATLSFFLENPLNSVLGVGYGNIHKFAMDYLPEYALFFAKGTAFTPKTGFFYYISSVGLVGIILLYAIFVKILFLLKNIKEPLSLMIFTLLLYYSIFNMMRNEPIVFLVAGLGLAFIKSYKDYHRRTYV